MKEKTVPNADLKFGHGQAPSYIRKMLSPPHPPGLSIALFSSRFYTAKLFVDFSARKGKKRSLSPSGKTAEKAQALGAEKQGLRALFGLRAQDLPHRLSMQFYTESSVELKLLRGDENHYF
jgi:hypothetical protein